MPVNIINGVYRKPGFRPPTPRPELTRRVPVVTGRVDNIMMIAYSYRTKPVHVADWLVSMNWTDDAARASIEAQLTFDDSSGISRKILKPGTWLETRIYDESAGRMIRPLPRLYVHKRSVTDQYQQQATIEAYDVLAFLMRQPQATYFFRKNKKHPKGWTASQIASQVLGDLDIDAEIVPTEYKIPYLLVQGSSPYDVIVKAFATDRLHTGVKYRIRAGRYSKALFGLTKIDTVVIDPVTLSDYTWELAQGSNLFSANWSESLDGVFTEIIGISMDKAKEKEIRRVRVVSKNAPRYGRLRAVHLAAPNLSAAKMEREAKGILQRHSTLKREASIEADGVPILRSCDAVVVKEKGTGMSGVFFLKSVSHTIDSGSHSMSVDLSYTSTFPLPRPTSEELGKGGDDSGAGGDDSGAGGVGSGYIGERVIEFARQQLGDPYVWGGNGPDAWDCSGLTKAAWGSVGITIGRVVAAQRNDGTAVGSQANAAPGDLAVRGTHHIGMFTGDGTIIHAPHTGDVVKEVAISAFSFDKIVRPNGAGTAPSGGVGGGTAGATEEVTVKFNPPQDEYLFSVNQEFGSGGGGKGGGKPEQIWEETHDTHKVVEAVFDEQNVSEADRKKWRCIITRESNWSFDVWYGGAHGWQPQYAGSDRVVGLMQMRPYHADDVKPNNVVSHATYVKLTDPVFAIRKALRLGFGPFATAGGCS